MQADAAPVLQPAVPESGQMLACHLLHMQDALLIASSREPSLMLCNPQHIPRPLDNCLLTPWVPLWQPQTTPRDG